MPYRFRTLALTGAVLAGLASSAAVAAPQFAALAEIIRADLPHHLTDEELSIAVFLPPDCEAGDLAILCRQFRDLQGQPGAAAYTADAFARQRSIAGQLKALPSAAKSRRFVLLLDWKFVPKTPGISIAPGLNGEVVVFDQSANKVVWHAVALHEDMPASPATIARDYIARAVLGELRAHMGRKLKLAATGIGVHELAASGAAGSGYNLVIVNRRKVEKGWLAPKPAIVSISSIPDDPARRAMVNLPNDTYVALSLPTGKYELFAWGSKPVEFEAGSQALAFRMGSGGPEGARMTLDRIAPESIEQERQATRNLLVPGQGEPAERTKLLGWSDIPAPEV